MIMKFSSTSYKYAGRVNDEIWTSSGLRGIARARIRPTTRETKYNYRALFSLEPAKAAWRTLGSATQTEWSNLADSTFGWPLQGSPRYMDGETFFANYYTVLLTLDEYAPLPDVPSGGPAWQTKPKFWEFAEWEDGYYTLQAETEFEPNTVLLFSGLPPTMTEFKPQFQREQFIGNEELTEGLSANEKFYSVDWYMRENYGPISSTQKIWGRIWEVQDGYIRTLKDPCTPDPVSNGPATEFSLGLYNNYDQQMYYSYIVFQSGGEDAGYFEWSDTPAFSTETGTMYLDEGYDTSMIDFILVQPNWYDYAWGYFELSGPFSFEPFEFTLYPNYA